MRLDLPQELPRRRAPESSSSAPALEPSPVELRREALVARALDRRGMPHAPQNRSRRSDPSPKVREKAIVPMDQRPHRHTLPKRAIGLSLRDEEYKLLTEAGRFRVVRTKDIGEDIYGGRNLCMERDLTFLRQRGLIEVDAVNARRDGRAGRVERIEVVTLTRAGQSFVRMGGELAPDQRIYAGLVKPREVEHDSQIYRAYRKEADRIEGNGGKNLRVKLDFELKSEVQKVIYAERKLNPERNMNEIKKKVARDFELPYVNGSIQIPDARIVYVLEQKADEEIEQGSRTGHEDIEVLTAAYSAGHLRAKAQAGFRVYASTSDRASVTAKIEGDHHLMQNIMEL